jgi:deoxyribose-phosphate aldolase
MKVSKYIDHTLLKADATAEEVTKLCREAIDNDFAAVCINPSYVTLAAKLLASYSPKVCTVVGFPLGANPGTTKAYEAKIAADDGAEEIDMVINIGAIKNQDYGLVQQEISDVCRECHDRSTQQQKKILVKVILETCLLTKEEIVKACEICVEAGADFVKTSTGFRTGGATVEDVALMRQAVGPTVGVKASGGIRDLETAMELINAGATRIGTSSGIKIVQRLKTTSSDQASGY